MYWYAHTKGIRHWGTPTQEYIKVWLNVMEECNFKNWRWAVQVLSDKRADVYGCLYMHHSYLSGNFWWASNEHVKTLPSTIEKHYSATEEWVLMSNRVVTIAETFPIYGDPYSKFPPNKSHHINLKDHYSLRFMQSIALKVIGVFLSLLLLIIVYSNLYFPPTTC